MQNTASAVTTDDRPFGQQPTDNSGQVCEDCGTVNRDPFADFRAEDGIVACSREHWLTIRRELAARPLCPVCHQPSSNPLRDGRCIVCELLRRS